MLTDKRYYAALIPIFVLPLMFLSACGFEIIDTGYRGIESRFGEIQGNPLPEGLHFYNPFTSRIREIDVREKKREGKALSYTRDTQQVSVDYALTYFPNQQNVNKLFREFGENWDEKIEPQIVQGTIKDVIGGYVADDLVGKREEARNKAQMEIEKNLEARGVMATRLDFVNLDFDDAYEKAVEAKVVAIQKAAEARNKTVEVEERAKQSVISAEAEAKSMTIRSQALSQNRSLVEYEAVQKWDGKLPQYMLGSGSMPFINLNK